MMVKCERLIGSSAEDCVLTSKRPPPCQALDVFCQYGVCSARMYGDRPENYHTRVTHVTRVIPAITNANANALATNAPRKSNEQKRER